MRPVSAILGVVFGLVFASAGFAQKTTGDITGTVTDSTGAVLPGVAVTAVCTATNLTRSATTDAQGGYSLPELPICVYKVTTELQGFKAATRDVQVVVNAVSKADFKLEVGSQSETITVEGVAPLIEFSDKLNNSVDTERITEIPLSGRDFNSLLAVTPGVQREPGGGFIAVSIAGMRHTSNNYMIDGISNNDRYYGDSVMNQVGILGVPASIVPMDAIAEFTIQQTPSAEFGVKGGAAINVVMKSGTNQVHGTGYYFRHDKWTDSPNFFVERSGGSTTDIKNQQYGGTFGGPIVKDKTFFFGYWEGQRLNFAAPYNVFIPRPSEIAAARARIAAAGLTTNPIGENLLKYYPTSESGQQTINGVSFVDSDTFSIKIDHKLGANNLINGRFFYAYSNQSAPAGNTGEIVPPASVGPPDMFNTFINPPQKTALFGLVWNSTISAHTLLETRMGYNTIGQTLDPKKNKVDPKSLGLDTGPLDPADFGVPAVYLGYFGYIGGVGVYPISTNPTSSWSVSSALTHTMGQHTLKVGGSWDLGKNHSLRNRARTNIDISGGTFDNVDSLTALLLGRFDDATRSFGSTSRNMSQPSFGVYVNDEWKASPRLTLSAGLRYDIHWPVSEASNIESKFVPSLGKLVRVGQGIESLYPKSNNFGPRAGLAWDLTGDGKTSFRTGYALTYDLPDFKYIHSPNTTWGGLGARAGAMTNPDLGIFSVSLVGDTAHAPDSPLATCLNPNTGAPGDYVCAQPGVPLYGNSPSGQPPFNAWSIIDNYRTPMVHYYHATFQREIFRSNAVTVSYVMTRGRDLNWFRDINGPPIGTPSSLIQQSRPFYSVAPDLGHIIQMNNDGKSWYDALQLSYRQNSWHGINTQYNYTLSKCEDYASDNSRGRNNFPVANNPYNPALNKGPCDFDRRHNFNLAGTYTFPGNGPIVGGWGVGSVFTALSGEPFTPNIGSLNRSGQNTGADRADCLAAPIYNYDPSYLYPANDPSTTLPFITNVAQAFAVPAPGRIGTCGRNSARMPGLAQWDVNLLKSFRLTSGARIEARWEIFNILNRPNLGFVFNNGASTNIRNGSFAVINATPDVQSGNPVIAQGGPRAMQWALKVIF
jgi:hypothetical protein